jgi:Spy/CpxP family protein refolding chaperone
MTRMRTLFAIVLPSMIAGGVLFGSALGRADAGFQAGFWPDDPATVVAQGAPNPQPHPHPHPVIIVPPVPPVPPVPGVPPVPPVPPVPSIGGMPSGDLARMVADQIQQAIDQVRNNPQIPAKVRDKVIRRLEKVRAKLNKKLQHLDTRDMEKFGEEMGEIGEEIGEEMGDFGDEMGKWAEKFGEQYGQQLGNQIANQVANQMQHAFGPQNVGANNGGMHIHIGTQGNQSHDGDDDDDDDDDSSATPPTPPTPPTPATSGDDDNDDNDSDDTVVQLGDLSLQDSQREQIRALRDNSRRQIEQARRQLEQASQALEQALQNVDASEAELEHAIDVVSQQEATIRKARIIAWHDARRVLDQVQRKKIEDAARAKAHAK